MGGSAGQNEPKLVRLYSVGIVKRTRVDMGAAKMPGASLFPPAPQISVSGAQCCIGILGATRPFVLSRSSRIHVDNQVATMIPFATID